MGSAGLHDVHPDSLPKVPAVAQLLRPKARSVADEEIELTLQRVSNPNNQISGLRTIFALNTFEHDKKVNWVWAGNRIPHLKNKSPHKFTKLSRN